MNDSQRYLVTVPMDRTLIQMIEAGKYDWVDPDITSERFPDIGPDGEYELLLIHFNRVVSTDEVISEMLKLGLTSAFIGQLLMFGEKYPKIQLEFPIVALSTVCAGSVGGRCSPCLYRSGQSGVLDLDLHNDGGWLEFYRFLAFRKILIAGSGVKKTETESSSLVPSGWTVLDDVPASDFRVQDLDFVLFLENGANVGTKAMRRRCGKRSGNLGIADAACLLANQDAIPAELHEKYILLPGTLLRDSGGAHQVPYLRRDGDRWVLDFHWLVNDWLGLDRIARCK